MTSVAARLEDGAAAAGQSLSAVMAMAAISLFIECLLMTGLGGGIYAAPVLLMHAGLVALLSVQALHAYRQKGSVLRIALAPLTAAAGPLGSALCLLAVLVQKSGAHKAHDASAWQEILFPEIEDEDTDRLHERIAFGLDDLTLPGSIEPFQDILTGGTLLQKQLVLAKIARHFRPCFTPFLLQAAHDANAGIRVQAATALSRIECDFAARCMAMEKKLAGQPEEHPDRLELAQIYDNYAFAGLGDEDSRRTLRAKAIAIYKTRLKKSGPALLPVLGRLYLRNGEAKKAYASLHVYLRAERNPSPGAVFWYLESLFRLRQYGKLRMAMKHYSLLLEGAGPAPFENKSPALWSAAGAQCLRITESVTHAA